MSQPNQQQSPISFPSPRQIFPEVDAPAAPSAASTQNQPSISGYIFPPNALREAQNLPKYYCPQCKIQCGCAADFKAHIMGHTWERPWSCPWPNCVCAFPNKSKLKHHLEWVNHP
ncbi:hypothetical protein BKA62DRAFT_775031 [Auriculariales sp. MPI-PUGE-AT-0066]|nr:hypothetical protein BKA62DRAFT_775031 [Auriculariales sp. MPI-PUGE-AT-0066]